jgi:hypothetical protein
MKKTRDFEITENEISEPPCVQIQTFSGTENFIQLIISPYSFTVDKYSLFRNAYYSGVLFIGLLYIYIYIYVRTFTTYLYTNSSNISATYGGKGIPTNAVQVFWAMEVKFQSFLNSVLDGDEW